MNNRTDPSKSYNQSILQNLRREFPSLLMGDQEMLEAYDDWSMSDKSLTFLQWTEDTGGEITNSRGSPMGPWGHE